MRNKYKQQGLGKTKVSGFDPVRYAPYFLRIQVLERDEYHCRYCGQKLTLQTSNIDHVIAWSRHGATVITNLVTACGMCNKSKSAGHGVKPRHLGKKPRDPFKSKQPRINRDHVTVPEYQTECRHNRSPNCLRQRCLEERKIPYTVQWGGFRT